jgi:hypothetical protein
MATLFPDLSIMVSPPRWVCVLDPSLVLSHYGLSVAKHLGDVMEVWVVRELWHMLDNMQFYVQRPESVLVGTPSERSPDRELMARREVIQSLYDWKNARMTTNPGNLNLFWIGDRPDESFLPKNCDPLLIRRWEALAQSLDTRLNHSANDSLAAAFRDTAALATSLDSALILTYQSTTEAECNATPQICIALESWGIPCQAVDPLDAIVTIERDSLRQIVVQTGLSKFVWAGLHLAVLHLVLPDVSTRCNHTQQQSGYAPYPDSDTNHALSLSNLWKGAKGFWYCV